MCPDSSPIETGLSLLYSHVSDATVWVRWWQNFHQMLDSWDCYEKPNCCAGRERVISSRISQVECTVNGKYAHPVSTGFSRIILAAGGCCSTGMVSLIGLGETVLVAGVRLCAPGVNKERMKRKVKQNDGKELVRMECSLDCSTLSPPTGHIGKWFFWTDPLCFTCCSWCVPEKRVRIHYRSAASPHFILFSLPRHTEANLSTSSPACL